MRPIDADALKQKLIKIFESGPYPENDYMDGWTFAEFSRDELKPIIDDAPTIEAEPNSCEYWDSESHFCALRRPQAEPIKRGRWKEIDYPWHECSECGERTAVVNLNGKVVWNYCPNCGAKMDEVQE